MLLLFQLLLTKLMKIVTKSRKTVNLCCAAFFLQTDICIVNGTCYDIKDRHCLTMDGNPKPIEDKKSYVIIIGAVVGGVCLLLLVGIVVVKIYNYKRFVLCG